MAFISVVPLCRLPRSANQRFTYRAGVKLPVGTLVRIPFRNSKIGGVVVKTDAVPKKIGRSAQFKTIISLLPFGALTRTQIKLADLIQATYGAPETLAYLTIIGKLPYRAVDITEEAQHLKPIYFKIGKDLLQNSSPKLPIQQIVNAPLNPTASIYLNHIARVIESNHQCLCLFSEKYALLSAYNIYKSFFSTAIWTSDQTLSDRLRSWSDISSGRARIIIGTRSAIFAPFRKLGSIVIFDASNSGHRSWDAQPHYDVRELAASLASSSLPVVMATSAPVIINRPVRYKQFKSKRAAAPIIIYDRRAVPPSDRYNEILPAIIAKLKTPTNSFHLIYANRFGNEVMSCPDCANTFNCPPCDIPLVISDGKMICRRCDFTASLPIRCPNCGNVKLRTNQTVGINYIAAALKKFFTDRTIISIDAISLEGQNNIEGLISKVNRSNNMVVVASSAILAKIQFFNRPDLVAIIRPECWLPFKNWRINEEYWTLLSKLRQVAKTEMLIDTYLPHDPTLHLFEQDDTLGFIKNEMQLRRKFKYPPFYHLIELEFDDKAELTRFKKKLPASAELIKMNQRRLLIKLPSKYSISAFLKTIKVEVKIDVDADNVS